MTSLSRRLGLDTACLQTMKRSAERNDNHGEQPRLSLPETLSFGSPSRVFSSPTTLKASSSSSSVVHSTYAPSNLEDYAYYAERRHGMLETKSFLNTGSLFIFPVQVSLLSPSLRNHQHDGRWPEDEEDPAMSSLSFDADGPIHTRDDEGELLGVWKRFLYAWIPTYRRHVPVNRALLLYSL